MEFLLPMPEHAGVVSDVEGAKEVGVTLLSDRFTRMAKQKSGESAPLEASVDHDPGQMRNAPFLTGGIFRGAALPGGFGEIGPVSIRNLSDDGGCDGLLIFVVDQDLTGIIVHRPAGSVEGLADLGFRRASAFPCFQVPVRKRL